MNWEKLYREYQQPIKIGMKFRICRSLLSHYTTIENRFWKLMLCDWLLHFKKNCANPNQTKERSCRSILLIWHIFVCTVIRSLPNASAQSPLISFKKRNIFHLLTASVDLIHFPCICSAYKNVYSLMYQCDAAAAVDGLKHIQNTTQAYAQWNTAHKELFSLEKTTYFLI